jgi:serine/threonine protein kinase
MTQHTLRPLSLRQVFLTPQYLGIAMEFAAGGDLFDYAVVRHKRLSEDHARWFFQQLIVALDYCHKMVRHHARHQRMASQFITTCCTARSWSIYYVNQSNEMSTALLESLMHGLLQRHFCMHIAAATHRHGLFAQ